jgi:hypothetical protein
MLKHRNFFAKIIGVDIFGLTDAVKQLKDWDIYVPPVVPAPTLAERREVIIQI